MTGVVAEVLAHLEAAYGAMLPGLREAYAVGLAPANQGLLPAGVVRAMRMTGRRLPSVEDILRGVREEAADQAARGKPRALPPFATVARAPRDSVLVRRTLATLAQVQQGCLSLAEAAEAWDELDRDFPGYGFDEAAREARARAARRAAKGLPTDRERHARRVRGFTTTGEALRDGGRHGETGRDG